MFKERSKGTIRNLTFKYNQLVNEEIDKRKSQDNSDGEIINKVNGKM